MLYAIVSDLHANLTAWKAVLADISTIKAGKIICLGDVVGYGPEPAEVLESVYRHVDAFVMGNHDAVVAGKMNPDNFNDHARRMILWSRDQIPEKGRRFLGEQPLVLSAPGFSCVHGSLDRPAAFNYILTPDESLDTWSMTRDPLVFIGHAHIPSIFVLGRSGTPHLIAPQDFQMEEGKRYIVNVGSVGDPRDDDPRASYCLYDDELRTITFRRVAFDYDSLRAAVRNRGLDENSIPLLRRDPVPSREAVRETLGFAPPVKEPDMARNVAFSGYIGSLRKTNRALRVFLFVLTLLLMAAAGVMTAKFTAKGAPLKISYPQKNLSANEAILPEDIANNNLVRPFPAGPLAENRVIRGWRYSLADEEKQHIRLFTDTDSSHNVVEIENRDRMEFVIEAPDWILNTFGEGRVQVTIDARRTADFSGSAVLEVVADRGLPQETVLISKTLVFRRDGSWTQSKNTMEKGRRIDKNTHSLSFRIRADFKGTLQLSKPVMKIVP